jgi:hypothetical protein
MPLSVDAQEEVKTLIENTEGKFFRVVFIERTTGEERTMDCRTGVNKFAKGEGLPFNPSEHGLVPVWDLRAYEDRKGGDPGYRFISLENVKRIKFRRTYYFA